MPKGKGKGTRPGFLGGKGWGKAGKGFGKGKYSKGKGKRSWRNPSGFANLATDDWTEEDAAYVAGEDDDEEPYSNPAHWFDEDYEEEGDAYYAEEPGEIEWSEFSAYVADEWSRKWDAEDPVEHAELECIACLFDVLGPECLEDPASCSNFVQNGTTAFLANSKGKKGKGKGKGKYPVLPSNLTIEDRRKKLAELKSKTECKDCGRRGHWKGGGATASARQSRKTGLPSPVISGTATHTEGLEEPW